MMNCVQPQIQAVISIRVQNDQLRATPKIQTVISMRLQNDQLCAECFAEERSLSTKQRNSSPSVIGTGIPHQVSYHLDEGAE
jgi:hypothetical protein